MKIENRPRPHYYLTIPLDTVKALVRLARAHYDATCQHAGCGASENWDRRNGILIVWQMRLSPPCTSTEMDATTRELDTLLKVCEIRHGMQLSSEDAAAVEDFVASVRQALSLF